MKKCKKLLATILAVLVVLSSLSITAFAAGDTMGTATSMTLGSSYSGTISNNSTTEFYKFTLSSSGRINIKLTAYLAYLSFYVYDSNGTEVWKKTGQYWNSTTQQLSFNENIDLTSGTYYFVIQQSYGYEGSYNVKITFTSANENYKENFGGNNNKISAASTLSLNTTTYGQIASNDDRDIYKFTMPTSGRLHINLSGYLNYLSFYIYDFEGNEIWKNTGKYWDSTAEKLTFEKNCDLSSGVFYFAIQQSYDYTGNYYFTTNFTSANESFKETDSKTDGNINSANSISLNTQYNGNIGINDEKDFYKFYSSAGKQ